MKTMLEIYVNGGWHETSDWIFRSWCGPRRKNGELFIGPRYLLGSDVEISAVQATKDRP